MINIFLRIRYKEYYQLNAKLYITAYRFRENNSIYAGIFCMHREGKIISLIYNRISN